MGLPSLVALSLHDVQQTQAGTGKRKADGEYASTRLNQPVTLRWARERFRQTMLLLYEFRSNWPFGTIVTNTDLEYMRVALDLVLTRAVQQGHVGSSYDMSPTVWACWMVQHTMSVRTGGVWQVESAPQQHAWSFENLYLFLKTMHARGDRLTIRDPLTKQVLHRYKLPFKAMNVPPSDRDLFKWKKGARQLSDWLSAVGLLPLDPGIIAQQPPTIVAPPPLAAQRAQRANAMWQRIGQRAGQYQLQTTAPGGDDDADAQETREVVRGVMDESRAAAASAIPVTAELVAPPPQQQESPLPASHQELVFHISELLEEMSERGEDITPSAYGLSEGDGAGPSGSS